MMIVPIKRILLEATRFEKEIKKHPFDKQVDWRRKNALNQLNTFGNGVEVQAYSGKSLNLSPILNTIHNTKSNSILTNYDESGKFKNLSAIEAQGGVSNHKQHEFLKDFKISDRLRERQLKNQANEFDKVSKDFNFRKKYQNIKEIINNKFNQDSPLVREGNHKINIYSGGGYHNFNNFMDKNKRSSNLLWVAPEGSSILNNSLKNPNFYAEKAMNIGDVPAILSAQVENKDLFDSKHAPNIKAPDEALVMKHTKIYNPIIKKVHLNSNGLELFMPSNLGNEYYKHFDKHETKYR